MLQNLYLLTSPARYMAKRCFLPACKESIFFSRHFPKTAFWHITLKTFFQISRIIVKKGGKRALTLLPSLILLLKFPRGKSQTMEIILSDSLKSQDHRQQALSAGIFTAPKMVAFATLLWWIRFRWHQGISEDSLESIQGLRWQLTQSWHIYSTFSWHLQHGIF